MTNIYITTSYHIKFKWTVWKYSQTPNLLDRNHQKESKIFALKEKHKNNNIELNHIQQRYYSDIIELSQQITTFINIAIDRAVWTEYPKKPKSI